MAGRLAAGAPAFVALLALLAVGAQAQAPGQGNNVAAFNDLNSNDLAFRFNLPTDAMPANVLLQSTSPALAATRANIVSRVFAIGPCSSFLPHYHPSASEYFVGRDGQLEMNILLNGGIVRRQLTPGDAILVPQGSLHFFYNNGCNQANAIVTLNSAAPGFVGFYDPPEVLTSIKFQTPDFLALLMSGTGNTVLNQTRAFPALTTDCQARCATPAPTAMATDMPTMAPIMDPTMMPTEGPSTMMPTTMMPTAMPTKRPTRRPTKKPTRRPTKRPTRRGLL